MAVNYVANLQSAVWSYKNRSLYTINGKASAEALVPMFKVAIEQVRQQLGDAVENNDGDEVNNAVGRLTDLYDLAEQLGICRLLDC